MPKGVKGASRKKSVKVILARDFFVRQFKVLEGYMYICRESFGLYHGKRSVKISGERDAYP